MYLQKKDISRKRFLLFIVVDTITSNILSFVSRCSHFDLRHHLYDDLSHAIENTANQKARNPLHILRYATGSIPRKNPGIPRGLQIFPAVRSIEEPATGQNFHSEKKYCQQLKHGRRMPQF